MNTLNWEKATPEQRLFWQFASAKIAYATITPLHYQGVILASEFATYVAGKIYLALDFYAGGGCAVMSATLGSINFYNEANVINYTDGNNDVSAANYMCNQLHVQNVWFSRILAQKHLQIIFIGYRLNT